jgi:hypothetical protein
VVDANLGQIELIILIGYIAQNEYRIENDTDFSVNFVNPFPNALFAPPILTNVYYSTGGGNTAASVASSPVPTKTGFTVVFDLPGDINERTTAAATSPSVTDLFSCGGQE